MAGIHEHRLRPHQLRAHIQHDQKDLSPTQILSMIILVPISGSLLGLAGLILVGTLIGLAVATPVFIIFCPILIPAAILLIGTVAAILTSGTLGLTGLTALSWVLNLFRQTTEREPLEFAKQGTQEAAREAREMVGEKTKQGGETIKSKAQEIETDASTGTGRRS